MHYKRLFSSDQHLGLWGSSPDVFLHFLKANTFDEIYLIGDFIDFWALNSKLSKCWTKTCNDIILDLVDKMNQGTKVFYTPGNHDECMKVLSKISIHKNLFVQPDFYIHDIENNRKLFITHGHQIDWFTKYSPWLCRLGATSYSLLIQCNGYINWLTPKNNHFSLSAFLKRKVKKISTVIETFEKGMTILAQQHKANIVICGHIHYPHWRKIDTVLYINTGDFVESLSCIVETRNGKLQCLRFNPSYQSTSETIPLYQNT
jgi:UDP-2,3-diacylglucosamine pyrophosphatase LpxH